MQRCVIILGMGRSGTSAVAHLLKTAGIDFGSNLIPADSFNPNGYFEDSRLCSVNQSLLAAMGSYHGDFSPWHDKWWKQLAGTDLYDDVIAIIDSFIFRGRPFGLKDPRLCRLLPLWTQALRERGVATSSVFVLRNPSDVAASLFKLRVPINQALLWWIRYVVEAQRNSRELPRLLCRFPDDVERPEAFLKKALGDLDLARPGSSRLPQIHQVFDSDLLHSNGSDRMVDPAADPLLLQTAHDIYRIYGSAITTGADESHHFARIEEQVAQISSKYRGWRDSYRQDSRTALSQILDRLRESEPIAYQKWIQIAESFPALGQSGENERTFPLLRLLLQNLALETADPSCTTATNYSCQTGEA